MPKVEVPKVELPKLPDPPPSLPDPGGAVSGATGAVNNATGAAIGRGQHATGPATGAVNGTGAGRAPSTPRRAPRRRRRRYGGRGDRRRRNHGRRLSEPTSEGGAFLEKLTDTSLYSIGAYFCDRHPELVDDVLGESQDIEQIGLARWAEREGTEAEAAFQTLITGLAVRYFKAVAERPARLIELRGVAQPGSARRSGRRGPRFKSGRPDNRNRARAGVSSSVGTFRGDIWVYAATRSRS